MLSIIIKPEGWVNDLFPIWACLQGLMFLADYRNWISAIGCIHIGMQIKHFLWALCCFMPCDYRIKVHRLKLLWDAQHLHRLCHFGNHSCRFLQVHEEMGTWGRHIEGRGCLVLLYCRFPVCLLKVSWENPQRPLWKSWGVTHVLWLFR